MKQVDLGPSDYRMQVRQGVWRKPLRPPAELQHASGRQMRLATAAGIWAAIVIGICRYWVHGESPWVVAAISLFPAAVLAIATIIND